MPDASVSAQPINVGLKRTSAVPERLLGQLNGRTVVTAEREEGRVNWVGHSTGAGYPVWTVNLLVGPEELQLTVVCTEPEEVVLRLTDLVAAEILRPYPLETTKEQQQ